MLYKQILINSGSFVPDHKDYFCKVLEVVGKFASADTNPEDFIRIRSEPMKE